MPAHMQSSLIFHYNLKFYDNDGDGYDGVSLKRFVMQVNRRVNSNEMKILSRGTIIHSCINNRGNERRKSRSLGIVLIDCSPITKLIDEEIR